MGDAEWSQLPEHPLCLVLDRLCLVDRFSLSAVCRRWREAVARLPPLTSATMAVVVSLAVEESGGGDDLQRMLQMQLQMALGRAPPAGQAAAPAAGKSPGRAEYERQLERDLRLVRQRLEPLVQLRQPQVHVVELLALRGAELLPAQAAALLRQPACARLERLRLVLLFPERDWRAQLALPGWGAPPAPGAPDPRRSPLLELLGGAPRSLARLEVEIYNDGPSSPHGERFETVFRLLDVDRHLPALRSLSLASSGKPAVLVEGVPVPAMRGLEHLGAAISVGQAALPHLAPFPALRRVDEAHSYDGRAAAALAALAARGLRVARLVLASPGRPGRPRGARPRRPAPGRRLRPRGVRRRHRRALMVERCALPAAWPPGVSLGDAGRLLLNGCRRLGEAVAGLAAAGLFCSVRRPRREARFDPRRGDAVRRRTWRSSGARRARGARGAPAGPGRLFRPRPARRSRLRLLRVGLPAAWPQGAFAGLRDLEVAHHGLGPGQLAWLTGGAHVATLQRLQLRCRFEGLSPREVVEALGRLRGATRVLLALPKESAWLEAGTAVHGELLAALAALGADRGERLFVGEGLEASFVGSKTAAAFLAYSSWQQARGHPPPE
eukprot:tig00001600_g9386.t1